MASRSVNMNKKSTDTSISNNVKVVLRVRPLNERELMCGNKSVVKVVDEKMLTFDPKEDNFENALNSKNNRATVLDKKIKDLHFVFDHVFDDNSTNENVFNMTTKSIVNDILDGYNCSVFAYGATSAGKTHTMLGSPEEPGVIFLTMMELYKRLMEKKDQFDTDISVSYLEIYNETCKDLLLPTGPLAVRENPDKKVVVNGLSLHKPRSPEELLDMLHFGNQNRTQHPTDANKQSSRSHAVFQVFVKQCPKDAGLQANITYAKISLIDLAGSERATVTTNRGDRLREGANINKSLLALGNCINALAENKNNIHIPYRNSKLTRLLKDSLGGNCKTVMIAAVSPSSLSYEDTHNTLKYASRAKNIKSSLATNSLTVEFHVSQYSKIVEDLKEQVSVLQEKLSSYQNARGEEATTISDKLCIIKKFEEKLFNLHAERKRFKQQLIDIEATEKELQIKLLQKERYYAKRTKLRSILKLADVAEDKGKIKSYKSSMDWKFSKLAEQRTMLRSALLDNESNLSCLHNELDEWANHSDDLMRAYVNSLYESRSLNLENISIKCQFKQMRRYFHLQETEHRSMERYIDELYEVISKQECEINRLSLQSLSPDQRITKENHDPCDFFNESKITWADQSILNTTKDDDLNKFDINSIFEFNTCTPFKTPSRKPDVFRQLILSSRNNEGFTNSALRENVTKRNTMLNKGPVRTKLCFNKSKADSSKVNKTSVPVDTKVDCLPTHGAACLLNQGEVCLPGQSQTKLNGIDSVLLEEASLHSKDILTDIPDLSFKHLKNKDLADTKRKLTFSFRKNNVDIAKAREIIPKARENQLNCDKENNKVYDVDNLDLTYAIENKDVLETTWVVDGNGASEKQPLSPIDNLLRYKSNIPLPTPAKGQLDDVSCAPPLKIPANNALSTRVNCLNETFDVTACKKKQHLKKRTSMGLPRRATSSLELRKASINSGASNPLRKNKSLWSSQHCLSMKKDQSNTNNRFFR